MNTTDIYMTAFLTIGMNLPLMVTIAKTLRAMMVTR